MTTFNKRTAINNLLTLLFEREIDGAAASVALEAIERLDCLPVEVAPPGVEKVEETEKVVVAGSMGRLLWYGRADNCWLGREGHTRRGDAYFTCFSGEVLYYEGGGGWSSGYRKVEVGQGPVAMRDWAVELGFTVDPCPFTKEEPPVSPLLAYEWSTFGYDVLLLPVGATASRNSNDARTFRYRYCGSYDGRGTVRAYDHRGMGRLALGQKNNVTKEEAIAQIIEWAKADGIEVPPCPFIEEEKEEPAAESVGSDLDQLFAAFKSYLATPAGRFYRYYHIELWDDESGAIEGLEGDRLIEWSNIKEGVAKIKALIDKA